MSEATITEQAIAIVAKCTQTHDDAVARFHAHKDTHWMFLENSVIAAMVDQVILRLNAEARVAALEQQLRDGVEEPK